MDDLKVILWIIVGVIYLLARRKKSKPEAPTPRARPEVEEAEQPRQAPKTFEDLLREIEGMKQPKAARQPEVVDYDDNLGSEEQDLEDLTPSYERNDEKIYQIYEDAKAQAFHRPSLEDTAKLEDTIVRFKQFKGYEQEKERNILKEYVMELKNPQSFKKAFILSEVLRPKF